MTSAPLHRARAYLATLPPAIAGQGGHGRTFAAACLLVEFALNKADALELLCEWNGSHCQPPWTEAELRHKLADAFRATSPKEGFADCRRGRPYDGPALSRAPLPRGFPCQTPPRQGVSTPGASSKTPISNPGAFFFDAKAGEAQIPALAALRGLSADGLRLAYGRGLLRFGTWRTRAAWFSLDASQRIVQARRMDGQPWKQGAKAWTLPVSQAAWPVGIGEAADFPAIAFCEGGPDLLAACAFILAEGRERDVAPVAMLAGKARIHADALPMFADKRVRIFGHGDETGDAAAKRWAEQLADAGARVDAFSLAGLRRMDGQPVKDLCDLAAIHPDDFEQHRCLWELFDYARRP